MIISHKHRYLFVELPRTGSSAVSKELCENYDGIPILSKHANYYHFLRTASPEEKKYFIFSAIRNPLDRTVSLYFKYKNKNREYFNSIANRKNRLISNYYFLRRLKYVQNNKVEFPKYLMKFHKLPYNDWSSLSHKSFDFILRFENLQEDFSKLLKLIGIKRKRPLPFVNITSQKKNDFLSYYSPECIEHAKKVFGPFMKKWNYDFPPEWGELQISWLTNLKFHFFSVFRKLFWKYLK